MAGHLDVAKGQHSHLVDSEDTEANNTHWDEIEYQKNHVHAFTFGGKYNASKWKIKH